MVYGQIALLVTEIINLTFFVFEDVSEIFEFKAFGKQGLLFHFGFSVRIQCFQDMPVFAQAVVYVAHVSRFIFVEPVVVCVSALVGAEFLVGSAQ